MTCQHDRDVECLQDCPKCSRFVPLKKCNHCGDETEKLYACATSNGEKSVCWDCFFDSAINIELADIMREYIGCADIDEIRADYVESDDEC